MGKRRTVTGSGYLLDSHALLWWWFEPERLSPTALSVLTSPASRIAVSTASAWELSLKHHQGKLPELEQAITELPTLLQADGFETLPISLAHALRAGSYSQPHRDPFDRMLAAQAELDDLVLLSADRMLASFPCKILW